MDLLLLILIGIIGLTLFFFIALLLYRSYLRYSTRIETPNGIESLEEVILGGVKQWIFIRGTDQKNPILLFLHGGPGEPALGMSSSRKSDTELIRHYTVVHWDQRGAGKSYNASIPASSMTFDRLVEDCSELIDYLFDRFDTEKVFLVAHSGGTSIGIRTAHRYPGKIHAYVGVAQVINDYEQRRVTYDFILEEAVKSGNIKHQNAIKAIGPPPYDTPNKEFETAKHIGRYGGLLHSGSIMQLVGIVFNYLTSPEYSLSEGIRTMRGKGLHFTMNALWDEIGNIDFFEEIQSLQVPIYLLAGKYDMVMPTKLVENFHRSLDAERGRTLVIFEESAHFAMIEEKEKYQKLLIDVVLRELRES